MRLAVTFFFVVTLVCLLISTPQPARPAGVGGYVVLTRDSCDYFLVATRTGIDLFEWYSGANPDKNDFLVGSYDAFHSYGFHDIYDKTQDESMHIYVEDYDLGEDEALDKLNEACS